MMRRLLAVCATLAVTSQARAGFEDSLGVGPEAMALGGSFAARGGSVRFRVLQSSGSLAGWGARRVPRDCGWRGLRAPHASHHWGERAALFAASRRFGGWDRPRYRRHALRRTLLGGAAAQEIDGLNLGLALFIPGQLFDWTIRPDDDLQWALGDRSQVISIHGGLGWRINRFLSVGVSVRVLFNTQTNNTGQVTSVNIDPKTGGVDANAQIGSDAQVFAQAYPIVGVLITPIERLRIGLVYRNASYVNDWGTTQINGVPDLGSIGYSDHFAHYYEPLEVTLAASFDITPRLDVSADVTYARWSDALSTNLNFWGPGRWGDTVVPAFGVRWRATSALSLMAGYRFQKSPVDNFGGPSNLLDCDRHVESLGLDLHLGKLFHAPKLDVHLTAGLQYTVLVDRTEVKNPQLFPSDALLTSNPGYPSYSYGGYMVGTQATLQARW